MLDPAGLDSDDDGYSLEDSTSAWKEHKTNVAKNNAMLHLLLNLRYFAVDSEQRKSIQEVDKTLLSRFKHTSAVKFLV